MQLQRLNEEGHWDVYAEVLHGQCELLDELAKLADDPRSRGYAEGMVVLLDQIPPQGPRQLGAMLFHYVDKKNEIYEFIKGPFRLLCFHADGRVVVCSHIFRKSSNKTPKSELRRAIALRERYLAARANGSLMFV